MDYKYYSKSELRDNCVSECMRLIRVLTTRRMRPDGSFVEPMTQMQLASIVHLTPTQMSRISTGVCVPSAPVFYRLQEIHKSRLENGTL